MIAFTTQSNTQLKIVSPATLIQQLDSLTTECTAWEETQYKTANDALYRILSSIYRLYVDGFINGGSVQRQELTAHLEEVMKSRQSRVFQDASVLGLMVRYVFNCDRKRLHRYCKAIKCANSHGKGPDELAAWLRECGGIDEVSRNRPNKTQPDKAFAEACEREWHAMESAFTSNVKKPLAEVSIPGHTWGHKQSLAILVAARGEDESFQIALVIDSFTRPDFLRLAKHQAAHNVRLREKDLRSTQEANAFRSAAPSKVEQEPTVG